MTRLIAPVVLPPPVTGMTLATEGLIAKLASSDLDLVVRPITAPAKFSPLRWRLRKYQLLLTTILRLPRARGLRSWVYLVPDSGAGTALIALLALLARLKGYNVVAHHHVWRYFGVPTFVSRFFFRSVGPNGLHVVLCDRMRLLLEREYPSAGPSIVVCNLALLPDLEVAPTTVASRSSEMIQLGMLGNLTLDKGVLIALETMGRCHSEGLDVVLRLAGPMSADAQAAVENAVRRGFLVESVGPVDLDTKAGFLDGLDLLLFPSTYVNEADPLVVWESLSVGTPVLSTDVGCLASERAGVVVAPAQDFAKRAVRLCASPGELSDLRQQALATRSSSTAQETVYRLIEELL